jgi:hypothetical protein
MLGRVGKIGEHSRDMNIHTSKIGSRLYGVGDMDDELS